MLRTVCLMLAAAIGLGACAAPVVEGANVAKDQVVYDKYIDKAKAGDAEAQYKVGDALCCEVVEAGKKAGLYNTEQAVEWLCKAAAQGYGPAAYKLGKIYTGDPVDGVRLMRRVAVKMAGTEEDLPVAYFWLRQAEAKQVDGAQSRASSLWKDMTPAQRERAAAFVTGKAKALCQWREVTGTAG